MSCFTVQPSDLSEDPEKMEETNDSVPSPQPDQLTQKESMDVDEQGNLILPEGIH